MSLVVNHLRAIAAMAENRVIGNGPHIPWRLPEDFKFFKQTTLGGVLLMGRKTFDSIGKPLPGRETWVVSRRPDTPPGTRLFPSPEAALAAAADEGRNVWLAGGAELYRALLPHCSELLLTEVRLRPEGDVFFPEHETAFAPGEILLERPEFAVRRWSRKR